VFHVILYQPEIPPNTGNIIRLCANSGASLHLIEPLGFDLDRKSVRRAGLDYAQLTNVATYRDLAQCLQQLPRPRLFAVETPERERPVGEPTGGSYAHARYQPQDAFLFGPETRGLPPEVLAMTPVERRINIPMRPGNRSLNLSNAVAVVIYEAWRQNDFA